jgi:dTDP-4-amino-4,6-dideoxygalactose transaminase
VIRIAQPLIGDEEREAVLKVLDSGYLVNGPVTQELERRFAAEVGGTTEAVPSPAALRRFTLRCSPTA